MAILEAVSGGFRRLRVISIPPKVFQKCVLSRCPPGPLGYLISMRIFVPLPPLGARQGSWGCRGQRFAWAVRTAPISSSCGWSRIRGDSLEKGVCTPTTSLGSLLLLPVLHWATLTLPVAHSEGRGLESGDLRGWMAQSDHIMYEEERGPESTSSWFKVTQTVSASPWSLRG